MSADGGKRNVWFRVSAGKKPTLVQVRPIVWQGGPFNSENTEQDPHLVVASGMTAGSSIDDTHD